MSAPPEAADFSVPYRYPHNVGTYLAVNAIPDAYVAVDGPDCIYHKAEWVHGTHDLHSTLLDVLGEHRVVSTLLNSDHVTLSQGDELRKRLQRVAQIPGARLVLVTVMPHVTIIGTDYEGVLARAGLTDRVVAVLPGSALNGDWITAFASALDTLAQVLPIDAGHARPDHVAIIGYLMDRGEMDHVANVDELERLVRALDLTPVSTWLSGRPSTHLEAASQASLLLALPHGRAAARTLAARTGATVVEVPLPVGLTKTAELLRALAAATGRQAQAEALIDRETRAVVRRVEWLVGPLFTGRVAAVGGDPAMLPGLIELLEELGIEVAHAAAPTLERGAQDWSQVPVEVAWGPPLVRLGEALAAALAGVERPLLIGDTRYLDVYPGPAARLEIGFPCQNRHALFDRPFLGYRGWACLVDQLVQLTWPERRPPGSPLTGGHGK